MFWGDLRQAVRVWRQRPGLAVMAILTLALGIGATTAVFSLVEAVMLRPLPYRQPDQLMAVSELFVAGGAPRAVPTVTLHQVEQWRRGSRTLAAIGSFVFTKLPVFANGQSSNRVAAGVDPELLRTLGVEPWLGSNFAGSGSSQRDNSAILSWDYWQSAFHGARRALGASIVVDGDRYTVRGVLPADFVFPRADASYFAAPPDLLFPVANIADAWGRYSQQWFAVARLKPGQAADAAAAELGALAGRGRPGALLRVRLTNLQAATAAAARPALLLVLGISLILLTIACVNVMNLHFGRGAARQQEMAIRQALGAAPARLVRQLLTESGLLAVAAALLGLALARGLLVGLLRLWPSYLPLAGPVAMDGRVLGYAALATAAAVLLAGLAPAWRLGRTRLAQAAGQRSPGRGSARFQRGLMVAQVALGVALLCAAGLLARSLARWEAVPAGFRTAGVLGFEVSIPQPAARDRYAAVAEVEAAQAAITRLLAAARRLPSVDSAAWITNLPPATRTGIFGPCRARGAAAKPPPLCNLQAASGGYFQTVGIALLRGRDFNAADSSAAAPVALVNQALARRYWPGADPVGMTIATMVDGGATRTIVGEVADAHDRGLTVPAFPTVYVPYRQSPFAYGAIALRTALPPAVAIAGLRQRLAQAVPTAALSNFTTLAQRLRATMDQPRFYATLAEACAGMAILFVGLGLFGVISFAVSQRTREIAVRMALGARPQQILASVLRTGLLLAAVGVAAGSLLELAAARVMRGMLFELSPHDPVTLAGAAGLVLVIALAASYLPARRASRLDPLVALRDQ